MNATQVVFTDDFSVAGNLNSIKDYWGKLTAIGPKYGYFRKPMKSYHLIVKEKLMEAQNLFANLRLKSQLKVKQTLVQLSGV